MDPKSRHNYQRFGKSNLSVPAIICFEENAAEKPVEIYSFSLMEKEICRKVDEHEIIDLTVEEDTKLKADAEDLLQGLKTKIFPARDLPDDFHFSMVNDIKLLKHYNRHL